MFNSKKLNLGYLMNIQTRIGRELVKEKNQRSSRSMNLEGILPPLDILKIRDGLILHAHLD